MSDQSAIEDLANAIMDNHVGAVSSNVRNIIYTGLVNELCEQSPGDLDELFAEFDVYECLQGPSGLFYRTDALNKLQISLDPKLGTDSWFDVAAVVVEDVNFVYANLGPINV